MIIMLTSTVLSFAFECAIIIDDKTEYNNYASLFQVYLLGGYVY